MGGAEGGGGGKGTGGGVAFSPSPISAYKKSPGKVDAYMLLTITRRIPVRKETAAPT